MGRSQRAGLASGRPHVHGAEGLATRLRRCHDGHLGLPRVSSWKDTEVRWGHRDRSRSQGWGHGHCGTGKGEPSTHAQQRRVEVTAPGAQGRRLPAPPPAAASPLAACSGCAGWACSSEQTAWSSITLLSGSWGATCWQHQPGPPLPQPSCPSARSRRLGRRGSAGPHASASQTRTVPKQASPQLRPSRTLSTQTGRQRLSHLRPSASGTPHPKPRARNSPGTAGCPPQSSPPTHHSLGTVPEVGKKSKTRCHFPSISLSAQKFSSCEISTSLGQNRGHTQAVVKRRVVLVPGAAPTCLPRPTYTCGHLTAAHDHTYISLASGSFGAGFGSCRITWGCAAFQATVLPGGRAESSAQPGLCQEQAPP